MRTQPRFDVTDGNVLIKRRKRGSRAGRGVSMHEDDLRACLFEHGFHPDQHARGDLGERLLLTHDVQIEIRA